MFTKGHMRFLAAVVAVLCGVVPWAALAFENSAVPGPSGAKFTGGTVGSAVVLTGDNASGTGTLRIRPSDEDTQIVLCEASNNAATEVCSSLSHQNISATASLTYVADNGYSDSAGTFTRYNTGFGAATFRAAASSTQAQNFTAQNVYSTNGTHSGDLSLIVTGVGTSTFYSGASTTVTNDFRGPIFNGGSAACGGLVAGSVCIQEASGVVIDSTGSATLSLGFGTTAAAGQVVVYNEAEVAMGGFGCVGSTADADIADTCYQGGVSKVLAFGRTDDVAAGSVHSKWIDNYTATGVVLMELEGDGTLSVNALENEGSGTCNGVSAGAMCINESEAIVYSNASTTALRVGSSNAASSTQVWEYTQGTAGQATTLFATGTMAAPTAVGAVGYYGPTYVDADYAGSVSLTGIASPVRAIRADNPAAGTTVFQVSDDASASATLAGTTLMSLDGDGNLFLNAAATRSKGTKVLVAGTGTVTVASGSICTCTDTTAVAAVQCSVTTTTLTINGTGTDTIAYHCL